MSENYKRSHEQSISSYSPGCPLSPSSESGSQPPSSVTLIPGAAGLKVKELVGLDRGDAP